MLRGKKGIIVNMRILTVKSGLEFNAGPKAPRDIINILQKEYNAKAVYLIQSNNIIKKILYRIKIFNNIMLSKIKNEILVLQFPMYETSDFLNKFFMFCLKRCKKEKTVILIHDLEGLRNNDDKLKIQDAERLNKAKYVIAHNNVMKKFLEEQGVRSQIFSLELFDYLCNGSEDTKQELDNNTDSKKIVYAGNLVNVKSPFIYQIEEQKMKFNLELYGVGLEESNLSNSRINYNGKFLPDELPNKLVGDLGLVWDGNLDESDEETGMKPYTKFNNPHKLSCYMAAGLPVVVWEKAACSNFVKEYNIGYTIKSIYDINKIDFNDFNVKKNNVLKIKDQVREGYFTKKVFEDIIKNMKG